MLQFQQNSKGGARPPRKQTSRQPLQFKSSKIGLSMRSMPIRQYFTIVFDLLSA
jgi:hypothetical protein